jgi:hypothetical protein
MVRRHSLDVAAIRSEEERLKAAKELVDFKIKNALIREEARGHPPRLVTWSPLSFSHVVALSFSHVVAPLFLSRGFL